MSSLLKSTKNTRALLPDSLRFVRSDVPYQLSDAEIQWLVDRRLVTVIDLRQDSERLRKRCPLIDHPAFQYLCMPVTGGDLVPQTADAVPASYIRMVDRQMARIIETIWTAESNVLFFCNAGKDRTGVVSAILLRMLGATREAIVNDYMASAANLREMLDAHAKRFPQIDLEIITPHARYIEEFLDWLDSHMPETHAFEHKSE